MGRPAADGPHIVQPHISVFGVLCADAAWLPLVRIRAMIEAIGLASRCPFTSSRSSRVVADLAGPAAGEGSGRQISSHAAPASAVLYLQFRPEPEPEAAVGVRLSTRPENKEHKPASRSPIVQVSDDRSSRASSASAQSRWPPRTSNLDWARAPP